MPSIVEQTPYNESTANGVATVFPYTFQLLDADDLVVYADGVVVPSSDYSVSGVGDQAGGNVTFSVAPADGVVILRSREIELERDTDYQYNGPFAEATVDRDFNRLWQALQGLWSRLTGAVRAPYPEQLDALPDAATRANTILAFDADGQPTVSVPVSGSAADVLLQLANASSTSQGGWLVGWFHSFTGAIARTLGARNRDDLHLSDAGTTADMLTALNRIFTGYATGFHCHVEAGTWSLSGTASFTGQRMNLEGKGRQVSIVNFQPAATDVALEVNEPSAGGSNQGSIKHLGFTGGANTQIKTAIRLVNVANYEVGYIGISTGAWLGDSIGIKTEGRQYLHLHHFEIGCARPIVVGPNATFPSLSCDLSVFEQLEVIGSSASFPAIEFESGVSFGNVTIRNTDAIGGNHGVYWNDTTSTAAGFCLKISDFRTEQGLSAAGYSIYLASTAQNLQNLVIDNALLDSARNGIYLRNCLRVTLRNVTFGTLTASGATTALDITLVPGSRLVLENCLVVDPAAAVTITNGRCVYRERITGIGIREEWIYDAGFSAGGIASDVYHGGVQFSVASGASVAIADNTFCGVIKVTSSEDLSAEFELRGPTNQARELQDNAGVYSQTLGTATSVNIQWDGGPARYMLQNNRASTLTFSIFRIGSVI